MSPTDDEQSSDCPSDDELELAPLASCPWHIKEHIQSCARCAMRVQELQREAELIREIAGAVGNEGKPQRTEKPDGIEGYTRLNEIYRGGQGVVYKAVQTDTNRVVALKSLRSGHFASREERARFQREIELIAKLKHPGIVTSFGSGTADSGERFIAMEYIDGDRLDRWAMLKWDTPPEWTPGKLREFALLFVDLCDAAAHAQQRGIIHRDLKPSNVLVDESGAPRVLDFGIARDADTDESAQLTQGQEFVGTYAYAAPEQFLGGGSAIGTWTDVYSIGVMAYEILTGERPHPWTGSLPELTRAVCEDDPADPTTSNPTISRDIATIVLKAIAIDPDRRYQSAASLRDEFKCVATGEPIEARRDNTAYVLRRMASKYRWRVASAALVLFILVVAAPLTTYFAFEASREALEARTKAIQLVASLNAFVAPLRGVDPETSLEKPIRDLDAYLEEVAIAIENELTAYPELRWPVESALANALADRLSFDEALVHMDIALELITESHESTETDIAQLHHNFGRIYWKAARYEESKSHYEHALQIFTRILGTDHPRTADTAQHYASTLTFLNDFDLAESLLRRSLRSFVEHYGEQDPRVALSIFSLGRCLQEQGESIESVECFERSLELIEADPRPNDLRVGRAQHYLAISLIDKGELDQARVHIAVAMRNKEAIFGRDDREFAVTELLLARSILRESDPNKNALRHAETIARRAQNVLEDAHSTDQPETATAHATLGEVLMRQGKLSDARASLEHSRKMRLALLPEGSWPIGESSMLLAECLAGHGEREQAAGLAASALEILSQSRRPDDQLRLRAEALVRSLF